MVELLLDGVEDIASRPAFLTRATVRPDIATNLRRGVSQLNEVVAEQIRRVQQTGRSPEQLDPEREAIALLALVDGLSGHTLTGYHSTEAALAVLDYQLDRIFPPPADR